MSDTSDFRVGDNVLVSAEVTGHEFLATVAEIYSMTTNKFGLIRVVDQDNDSWDVEPEELTFEDVDDERDPFRDDVEADADALAGAGFGEDEAYGCFDTGAGDCW